MKNYIKEEKNQ